MATYVAFTQAANTPALPAGTTTGDWVVVFAYRDLNATAPTLPANWTQINVRNTGNGLLMAYREKDATWSAPPAFTNATRAVAITVRPASGKVLALGVNAVQGATASNVAWAVQTLQVTNGTSVFLRGAVHTRPDATIGTAANHTLIESTGTRPGFITQRKTTTTDAAAATTTVSRSDVMSSGQVEIKDIDPPVSITQAAYQFFALGTEAGSTALASQSTSVTADMAAGDVPLQLRMRLQSTSTTAPVATDDWCLQWEKNASGTWADVSIDPAIAVYAESNVTGSVTTTFQSGTGFGQSFDGTGRPVVEASFWMSRTGSPGGTLTASIYAHSGTYGTSSVAVGTVLHTSAAVNAMAVPTTAGWVDFVFDGTWTPVAGTKYVIVWDHSSTFDASNNILSYVDTTTPTHAGNLVNKNFGGGFTATAGSDLIFEICGPPTGAAPWDDPSLTDGEATTNRLTGGTGGFTAGKVSEHGTIEDFGFPANAFTELVFSMRLLKADLVNADTLRFRIERNDATTGMTFSSYPTINVVAPVAAVTQAAYRFYDINGFEATGAALAAQDTPISGELGSTDHLSMLRVRMQSTTAFNLPATDDWRLQFRVNAGAWTNVTATSGAVQGYASALNVGNGDPTTERLTGGTGTFTPGVVRTNGTANNIGFGGNNFIEFVYTVQLQASLLANGDTVQFQVLRNALTTDVTYTQVPSISVVKTPLAVTQADYRFYEEGTEAGSTALAAQNTAPSISIAAGDVVLQLRNLLQSTSVAALPVTDDWKLQYELNASGTWITVNTEALLTTQVGPSGSGRLLSSSLVHVGQSFLGDGNSLSRVAFLLDRTGSPPGNMMAQLYAHTGTFGSGKATGSPLATSQSLPTNVASGELVMVSFSFAAGFPLESGVPYVIALACDSATGLNVSNAVTVWGNTTGTHPGAQTYTTDGTNWFNETWDVMFEVYTGSPSGAAVAPYASPLLTGGEPTTNRLTGGTGTFTAGEVSVTGRVDDLGFPGNNFTEIVYSLQVTAAAFAGDDSLRFRVLRNDGTTGLTYGQTPTISIVSTAPPVTANHVWTISPATGLRATSGTSTSNHLWLTASSGKRVMQGAATTSHVWSMAATGKRVMQGQVTAAHTWNTAPATGKKTMRGTATAAHVWSNTATGKRTMQGTSTATHVWNATATGVMPTLAVKQGSAIAQWTAAVGPSVGKRSMKGSATAAWSGSVGYLVDDDFLHPGETFLINYGYLSMYDSTLYLDGNGNAIASGYGGVTHPNAVLNNSWMEIAFRLDDVASYVISMLFKLPTASESNGTNTGYAVTINELGVGIDRLGVRKTSASPTMVNTKDYVMRVEWTGGTIRVFRDGTEILNWPDSTPLVGNYVGLYLDNNYGSSDKIRYLHAGTAAVGQTPGGVGSATVTHTWNVAPAQGRKPQKGQATTSHLWSITPAQGKKNPIGQGTATHLWTIAPATGVQPIVGVKQGVGLVSWTATVAPAVGKRITRSTSVTAAHLWTIAPSTGKRVMRGQATSTHTWTIGPATGKPIRKGQATSTHLWTTAPATGRRTTYGQAAASHLWKVTPATGIMPIVGVKQGTAVATHTWTTTPAVGKKNPIGQSSASHTWTSTPVTGKRFMRGQATSAHTWTITPATGKRSMYTTLVVASHLWTVGPTTGKRFMRGQATATHTWNTFPATGIFPIVGVKQGTALARHDWTTTLTSKKVMKARADAVHAWALLATGTKPQRGSSTSTHLWNVTVVGKRILRSGQVTAAHLWTLFTQGVRPAVGVKQGTAIASHTWAVGPVTGYRILRGQTSAAHQWTTSATGKKVMRGQATSAHLWSTNATGKKVMQGSAAVTHLWSVNPSTGRLHAVGLATVIHVWRSEAEGLRFTRGFAVPVWKVNVNPARGSQGIVGVVQGWWDGAPVVAMMYGDANIFEFLMITT